MASFQQHLVTLQELRNNYFAGQVSLDQYRATRNHLLDELSTLVNGQYQAMPESQIPTPADNWQDQNPFS